MRLDQADDHVDAALTQGSRFFQHAKCLAHAGRETEIELELAALGALDELEKILCSRTFRTGHTATISRAGLSATDRRRRPAPAPTRRSSPEEAWAVPAAVRSAGRARCSGAARSPAARRENRDRGFPPRLRGPV